MVLGALQPWHDLEPEFFDEFVEKRAMLDINVFMVVEHSPWSTHRKGPGKKANERFKLHPKQTTLRTNLVIIPSKVVIHQLVPPIMAMV